MLGVPPLLQGRGWHPPPVFFGMKELQSEIGINLPTAPGARGALFIASSSDIAASTRHCRDITVVCFKSTSSPSTNSLLSGHHIIVGKDPPNTPTNIKGRKPESNS